MNKSKQVEMVSLDMLVPENLIDPKFAEFMWAMPFNLKRLAALPPPQIRTSGV